MINFNGLIVSNDTNILTRNRAFLYGDAVFETVKIMDSKVLFLEDHYFRLMSSMRVIRMEIPMNFTMEYLEEQILTLAKSKNLAISFYSIDKKDYVVDLYTDFYVSRQLLSSIKTTNKIINITASIFANENGLDNCLLLNDSKSVIEALQGNLFMLKGNTLITPPVSEGCLNGVMRKQILTLARKIKNLEVVEEVISPFDLQKADELFITNVIKGIQPITKYRKKEFTTDLASKLVRNLNDTLGSV